LYVSINRIEILSVIDYESVKKCIKNELVNKSNVVYNQLDVWTTVVVRSDVTGLDSSRVFRYQYTTVPCRR